MFNPMMTAFLQAGGGLSPWVWVLIIIVIVILLLWWLGRQDVGEQKEKAGKVEASAPAMLVEAAPEPVAAAPVAVFPEPEVEEKADEMVAEVADTTAAVEYAPPEAPPAVTPEGPIEGFPNEGTPARGPARLEDLELIEGIGPKIASVLRQAGIETFAQLAVMHPSQIRDILTAAGIRLADPATWPEQAQLAMEGKWDEFEALTKSLRGGRRAA